MNNGKKKKTLKQLEQELKEAQQEYSNQLKEMKNMSLNEFEKYLEPFEERVNSLSRELRMMRKPNYESLPPYGDLMTLEEFLKCVKDGFFIDYDGHGNYSTNKQMTDIIIYPSDVEHNSIRKEFSHVVWFNR